MPAGAILEESTEKTSAILQHGTKVDAQKGEKSKASKWFGKNTKNADALTSSLPDSSSPETSAVLQLVKLEGDQVLRRSEILLNALNELQQIHPFVSGESPTITRTKLESTRRDNDRPVTLIRVALNDLFSEILLIKDIPREGGEADLEIKFRFEGHLENIEADIRECSAVCDAFQNKHTIVKFFTSPNWEKKFEDFLTKFKQHREVIHDDLIVFIAMGMKEVQTMLSKISQTISIGHLLQLLRSPEERELQYFVDANGGPASVLKNNELMQELIKRSGESASTPWRQPNEVFQEIMREIKMTVADSIEANMEQFSLKFLVQQQQMTDRLETSMQHALGEGPHERIIDPVRG
ncbi:hypothetical protein D9757_012218 [Collybiopsis confluens]|uniref:Uncharacterized protein n=1 Tax=Collybiopsis confluens TaxID=2823264 RepID=A0A8H5LRU1_9AGAR|nr:hypothetical protein D9757_012218 [Collybiopsis confluens]